MHGCDTAISIQTGIVTRENNLPLPWHRGWALCSLLSPSSALKGRKLSRTCPGLVPVFRQPQQSHLSIPAGASLSLPQRQPQLQAPAAAHPSSSVPCLITHLPSTALLEAFSIYW